MMVISSALTWSGCEASEIEMIRSSYVLIRLLGGSSAMSLMSSQVLSTNEGSDVESGLGGDSKSIDWGNNEGQEGVAEVEDL